MKQGMTTKVNGPLCCYKISVNVFQSQQLSQKNAAVAAATLFQGKTLLNPMFWVIKPIILDILRQQNTQTLTLFPWSTVSFLLFPTTDPLSQCCLQPTPTFSDMPTTLQQRPIPLDYEFWLFIIEHLYVYSINYLVFSIFNMGATLL